MANDKKNLLNVFGALALAVSSDLETQLERKASLSTTASAALLAIAQHPGESIDVLSRVIQLSHSGTVRAIDRLVAAGFVMRAPGSDARSVGLTVTESGRERAQLLKQTRQDCLEEYVARLSPIEREQLRRLCHKLLTNTASTPTEARTVCRLCDESVCFDKGNCPVAEGLH
jgi:DNA-binding MarR family transcriptional regulator